MDTDQSVPAIELAEAEVEPEAGWILESLRSDRKLAGSGAVLGSGEEALLSMAKPAQPAWKLPDAGFRSHVGGVGSAEAESDGKAVSTCGTSVVHSGGVLMKSTPSLSQHARSSEEPGAGTGAKRRSTAAGCPKGEQSESNLHAGICKGPVGRPADLP